MDSKAMLTAFLAVLCASAAAARVTEYRWLDDFNHVVLCVPFNVAIRLPSTNAIFGVRIDVDDAVAQSLQTVVTDGQLVVSVSQPFESRQPIRVYVELPPFALQSVTMQGSGSVFIAPPRFTTPALNITSSGTGNLFAPYVNTDLLTVATSGTGDVSMGGEIGSAQVTAREKTTVTIVGLQRGATVSANGNGNIAFGTTSDSAAISGTVQGNRSVLYDLGTCNVKRGSKNVGEKVADVTLTATPPTFTCGLRSRGNSNACGTNDPISLSASSLPCDAADTTDAMIME